MSCGYGPYVDLMKQYPLVTDAFLKLKPMYQPVLLSPMSLALIPKQHHLQLTHKQ